MSENGGPEIKKTGPPPQGNRQPGGSGQNNGAPTGQSGPSIDKLMMIFLLGLVMTMLFNSCMNNFVKDTATKQISYSEFMEMAKVKPSILMKPEVRYLFIRAVRIRTGD